MAHWPVEHKTQQLSSWFDTPAGRRLLEEQAPTLAAEVRRFHGESLLWLGCHRPEAESVRRCMVRHRFYAAMHGTCANETFATFQCDPQVLPFPNHCVSGVVAHFALECVADPRMVLRELARVLEPGGRLLLFGLNPISLWGAWKTANFMAKGRSRLNLITSGRLLDWLTLLGFELDEPVKYLGYGITGRGRWPLVKHQLEKAALPIGAIYYLSAIKQVPGIMPKGSESALTTSKLAPAGIPRLSSR